MAISIKQYQGKLTDGTGMHALALVDNPAIMVDENWKPFVAMSVLGVPDTLAFKVQAGGEEKRLAFGPLMIPDLMMARDFPPPVGVCEMFFDAQTIEAISQKFMKELRVNDTNSEHETPIEGVFLSESWIVMDPANDKAAAMGFNNLPVGTWFGAVKVENDGIWEDVKSGTYRGFSIEGIFNLSKISLKDMAITKVEVNKSTVPVELSQYIIQTPDTNGTMFQVNIDTSDINVLSTDKNLSAPPDGRYTFPERNCSVSVMAGKITEVIFENIWMFRTEVSEEQKAFFAKFEDAEQSKWLKLAEAVKGTCVECAKKSATPLRLGITLAALLNQTIEGILPGASEEDKAPLLGRIAEAAQVDVETIKGILTTATACPTMGHLQAFAAELKLDVNALVTAAKTDGCTLEGEVLPGTEVKPTDAQPSATPLPADVAAAIEAAVAAQFDAIIKPAVDAIAEKFGLSFAAMEQKFVDVNAEGATTTTEGTVSDVLAKLELIDTKITTNDAALADGINQLLSALELDAVAATEMKGAFGDTGGKDHKAALREVMMELKKQKNPVGK